MDDFFALADTLPSGEKFRGYKPKHVDPLVRDKGNFQVAVQEQIDMIKTGRGKVNSSGNRSGNMFEVLPSGKIRVTLKNGITVMKVVPNKEFYDLPDAESAEKFLVAAAVAAHAGKFDEVFKATARKPPKKKGAAVANVIDSIKAAANGHAKA
jgi:hypothetical protein